MSQKFNTETFGEKLQSELVQVCRSVGLEIVGPNGAMLSSPDIDGKWMALAGEYIADAMRQLQDYPTVSMAWASYLGAAVACGWDRDWLYFSNLPYSSYLGAQGFDDMDDHIVQEILGVSLDSETAGSLRRLFQSCADAALSCIRHENIEAQSVEAYYAFVTACQTMYRVGAAVELHLLGYKFERIN